jgi:hypothetical protein
MGHILERFMQIFFLQRQKVGGQKHEEELKKIGKITGRGR